jgi:hypothetical protein
MSELQPDRTDAILGGQNPPPVNAAVLGGVAGAKQRLQHEKALAREQKFWRNFEYLNRRINKAATNYQHAAIFANRRVINFEPDLEIVNPKENAYAIRVFPGLGAISYEDKLFSLIGKPNSNQIEALVFGTAHYGKYIKPFDFLINFSDALPNLEAIFLGDFNQEDMYIGRKAGFSEGNLSQVLSKYSQLQLLQIRAGSDYVFSECRHEKIKALRIEMSYNVHQCLNGINKLDLPALEYLELWIDAPANQNNLLMNDLNVIFYENKFPKLKYLGIKNCSFVDDVATSIAKSPLMEGLIELDLSLGNLSSKGLSALLSSNFINELDVLNVSASSTFMSEFSWAMGVSSISPEFITKTIPEFELSCKVIVGEQGSMDVAYVENQMRVSTED